MAAIFGLFLLCLFYLLFNISIWAGVIFAVVFLLLLAWAAFDTAAREDAAFEAMQDAMRAKDMGSNDELS